MTSCPGLGIPFLGVCDSSGTPFVSFPLPLGAPHNSQTIQEQHGSFSLFLNQASGGGPAAAKTPPAGSSLNDLVM